MKMSRLAGGCAVGLMLLVPGLATAGWDNVFQLTCCGPRTSNRIAYSAPAVAYYAPAPAVSYYAAPNPCCPQTQYVQRSFYQPVTTYKPVMESVPVTSYRTSYYWEPVASCSYSLYVDPCTGCAQQVATPTTSYYLRSQCNAVTGYVQRVSYQPVVEQRLSYYLEPVTVNPCATPVAPAPTVSTPPPPLATPPSAQEQIVPNPASPPLNPSSDRGVIPSTARPSRVVPSTGIRADRIASRGSAVSGVIVRQNIPQPNARLRFVDTNGAAIQNVTTDAQGRFQVTLTSGNWKIYVDEGAGRTLTYDFTARGNEARNVTLVSR